MKKCPRVLKTYNSLFTREKKVCTKVNDLRRSSW